MPTNQQAFENAKQKIDQARRDGATELDLSCGYRAKDSEKLTELPESVDQLTQLQTLDLSGNQLTALPEWPQGSTLRELHALLKDKDPAKSFGGLVRVQNKRREFLWVHSQYRNEY